MLPSALGGDNYSWDPDCAAAMQPHTALQITEEAQEVLE